MLIGLRETFRSDNIVLSKKAAIYKIHWQVANDIGRSHNWLTSKDSPSGVAECSKMSMVDLLISINLRASWSRYDEALSWTKSRKIETKSTMLQRSDHQFWPRQHWSQAGRARPLHEHESKAVRALDNGEVEDLQSVKLAGLHWRLRLCSSLAMLECL